MPQKTLIWEALYVVFLTIIYLFHLRISDTVTGFTVASQKEVSRIIFTSKPPVAAYSTICLWHAIYHQL